MSVAARLALLAAASLGLTALRYGAPADLDARWQSFLLARFAAADVVLVAAEATPAFRVLHLRRIGCPEGFRLAFAPDDGAAAHALARLLPHARLSRAPSGDALRPGWIVATEGAQAACVGAAELAAILGDTKG